MATFGKNRSTRFWVAPAFLCVAALITALFIGCGTQAPGPRKTPGSAGGRSAKVAEVSASNFDEQVLRSEVPVLVDFYADWCDPCKRQAPILEELAGEIDGAKIVKLDVDANNEIASRYKIDGIPALLLFKNGEVVARQEGLANRDEVKALLAR